MNVCSAAPLPGLAACLVALSEAADRLDRDGTLPGGLERILHKTGALADPLPRRLGGRGLGTEPHAASLAVATLRLLGRSFLPLGRLYEGHVNALRLILLYGTPQQMECAADDARAGHLFAVWIAEDPRQPVRLENGALEGVKSFASGVGAVSRAVVTAAAAGSERMAFVRIPDDPRRVRSRPELHGMRAAGTAEIDLSGIPVAPDALIGTPGDYMRQPEITLGSWRPLAVLAGGVQALVDALRADLGQRGRSSYPQQRARLAACLMAQETAALWAERAGLLAETRGDADAAAYVQLARGAVDAACSRAIQMAQRCAGLAAFARPHPIERLCRDLATYQRQPALDEVIDEAAARFIDHPLPA